MSLLKFLARLVISILLIKATPFAQAADQPACARRDLVVQRLEQKFGETLRSMGLNQSEGLVEIFASRTTGTWTILMTKPDGVTCLLAAGKSWAEGGAAASVPGVKPLPGKDI